MTFESSLIDAQHELVAEYRAVFQDSTRTYRELGDGA